MPLVLADRVRETTTTTGTGTISLAGPVSGFQGFSTAIGNANTTYYTIVDAATGAWEVGLGTYTSAGSTLARTTVLSSSNSDALVPFAAGTKDVFVTQPAERAVYVLGAGTGLAAGAAAFTANGVPYASATNTLTTGSALTFDGTNLQVGGNSQPIIRAVSSSTNNATARLFTDGDTVYIGSANTSTTGGSVPVVFQIGGSEQMRLTSTGLGIGTSSITEKLTVNGNIQVPSNGFLKIGTGNYLYADTSATELASATKISLVTNGALRATLDSSGNLGIGTSSPSQKLHVVGSVSTGLFEGSTFGGITLQKTGTNGVQLFSDAAGIFKVYNNQTGATNLTLDSSGNLGLGVTPSAWEANTKALQIANAGAQISASNTGYSGANFLWVGNNSYLNTSNNQIYARSAAASLYRQSGAEHAWFTAPSGTAGNAITFTQAMTLDASGNLLVGTTSVTGAGASVGQIVTNFNGTVQNGMYVSDTNTSAGTDNAINFGRGATLVGRLDTTLTSLTLTNLSDQRVKSNIQNSDSAIGLVSSVKVRKFDWTIDNTHEEFGFVAQELNEVLPQAVSVGKTEDEMWGVNFVKLVPILTKAIQELKADLDATKAELAALKGA